MWTGSTGKLCGMDKDNKGQRKLKDCVDKDSKGQRKLKDCQATGSCVDKDSKGQRKLEDPGYFLQWNVCWLVA